MKNKAIVSIGCNHHRTKHVRKVVSILERRYPGSRFSTPEITEPIDLPERAKPFLNLVALIYTTEEKEEFASFLKKIEQQFGRNEDDDEEGIIPMDLDLIEWNNQIFKPQDLVRPYVVAGLDELDEL